MEKKNRLLGLVFVMCVCLCIVLIFVVAFQSDTDDKNLDSYDEYLYDLRDSGIRSEELLESGKYKEAYNEFCSESNERKLDYLIENAFDEELLMSAIGLKEEYLKACVRLEDLLEITSVDDNEIDYKCKGQIIKECDNLTGICEYYCKLN